MATNNKNINIENVFKLIIDLKKEFEIIPEINCVEELNSLLHKEVIIIHKDCGHQEKNILLSWLNLKRSSKLQNESNKYIHYCTKCFRELKKTDLQEFLDKTYNNEFIIDGDYIDFNKPIGLKHTCCDKVFYKTPTRIRNSQLFCKYCGKSDSIYEQKKIDEINNELDKKLKELDITTYQPLEDCPGLTKKMKFKHLTCNKEFVSTPYDVYSNYYKHDHCPNCFKKKVRENTSEEIIASKKLNRLKNRYIRFKKFSEEYKFVPEINSFEDFKEHSESVFSITHISCGTTVNITLDEWSKQRSSAMIKIGGEKYNYFCAHCSRIILKEEFQQFLDKKYNKEFTVIGDYVHSKQAIEVLHNTCGTYFDLIPSNAKQKKVVCKGCNSSDKKTELKLQNKKNQELLDKLKKQGLEEFIPLEDNKGVTKIMKFKHLRCGNIIEERPQDLLRRKSVLKHFCDKCPEEMLNNSNDSTLRTKHAQDALDLLYKDNVFNIVGDFDDYEDSILLRHNKCNNEFMVTKKNIFTKTKQCPHCETNNFKNNKYISLNEKIKLYEDILNNEYKILKPFVEDEETVPFKHLACGHIFERTVSTYLRAKDKIFCPICRKREHVNSIQAKIDEKYNGEYIIENPLDYNNIRADITFKHTKCGHSFIYTVDKLMIKKGIACPKCNPDSKTLEAFKSEMYEKCKGEYIIRGKFEGYSKKLSFRHKKCGRVFSRTPKEFLNSKVPCLHCIKDSTLVGIEEAQRRVNEASKGLFKLNGIYRGIKKEMPVTCNECGHVFESTPKKMFLKKR